MSYQRIVLSEYGGPEVMRWVTEPALPEPAVGEVRVRVLATSASYTDTLVRRGIYPGLKPRFPFSPGYDMVGLVDKCGPCVTALAPGQMVADLTVTGACSQFLCWPADRLVPVPAGLDPAEAVSLVLTYVTAFQMLNRVARVQPGQAILVHGAGGAVGTALLQMARLTNLNVAGTASEVKLDLVTALGATPIDYRRQDFVQAVHDCAGSVDAIFDAYGGANFRRSFRCLRRGGRLVAFGFFADGDEGSGNVPLDFLWLWLTNLLPNGRSASFYSIAPWRRKHPDWFRQDLGALFSLLAAGEVAPVIAHRMPLAEAAEAHRLVETSSVQGKIVLLT